MASLAGLGYHRAMPNHIERVRRYLELETSSLMLAGERSRVLDHNVSRGSDVEHIVRDWLRRRVEPHYTASAGEIIDAYDTDVDLDSRQQDIVIHENSIEANAFALPSGLRLIPVETVAAVVEVKLTLNQDEFDKSDAAATQTARLKLSVREELEPVGPGAGAGHENWQHAKNFNENRAEQGVPLSDADFHPGPLFAVFSVFGIKAFDTLAKYIRDASTVRLVSCLEGGASFKPGPLSKCSIVSGKDDALTAFARAITTAVEKHKGHRRRYSFHATRYYPTTKATYWDETGFEMPEHYQPTPEELKSRELLMPGKRFKR